MRSGIRELTLEDVNAAIRRHLRWDGLKIVMVGEGMTEMRESILANRESPMTYNSPKPDEILAEDEVVMRREICVAAGDAEVVAVDEMFA